MTKTTKKNEPAADAWPAPPEWAKLVMYAVYFSPVDFWGKYVMRRWFVKDDETEPVMDIVPRIANTYESIMQYLPQGLVKRCRHELDDAAILEMWL